MSPTVITSDESRLLPFSSYTQYPDRRLVAEAAIGSVLARVGARFLRKRIPPSLADLAAVAEGFQDDPAGLLRASDGLSGSLTSDDEAAFASEHEALQKELSARYARSELALPERWAVERGTAFLLYVLVRATRPETIIEIGVGNGQSSFFLLHALRANGSGRLISFDIVAEAGGLINDDEHRDWDLRVVNASDSANAMSSHFATLPKADLAFHDAGHAYLPQRFDFQLLWEQLAPKGWLVVDDVDSSYAFVDFCHALARRPEVLIDSRKAVGVITKRPPVSAPGFSAERAD